MNLKDTLSLEEAGAYKQPEITQDDAALKERLETMNRYVSTTVTYKFGDKSEVLNGDRTHEWLVTDESGGVSIDTAPGGRICGGACRCLQYFQQGKEF